MLSRTLNHTNSTHFLEPWPNYKTAPWQVFIAGPSSQYSHLQLCCSWTAKHGSTWHHGSPRLNPGWTNGKRWTGCQIPAFPHFPIPTPAGKTSQIKPWSAENLTFSAALSGLHTSSYFIHPQTWPVVLFGFFHFSCMKSLVCHLHLGFTALFWTSSNLTCHLAVSMLNVMINSLLLIHAYVTFPKVLCSSLCSTPPWASISFLDLPSLCWWYTTFLSLCPPTLDSSTTVLTYRSHICILYHVHIIQHSIHHMAPYKCFRSKYDLTPKLRQLS